MSGSLPKELFREAGQITHSFKKGLWALGIFLGIVISLSLLKSLVYNKKDQYEPDQGLCVSCGRCMPACPVNGQNQSKLKEEKIASF